VQLSAVVLARTLAFIEFYDLNSKGKLFWPEVIKGLAERYKFQRLPKREEYDKEGVIFEEGKFGNKVITNLTFYDSLIKLETRSSTSDSKQLIEEMLQWGVAKFDINYKPGLIKRWGYVSAVTFHSDVPILSAASRPLVDLAANVGAALTDIWQEPIEYFPAGLSVGYDPMARKNPIAAFTILHRAETRFSENKYFSEAPLPTDMHIAFLEQFENGVIERLRVHGR
jgi:hypothetical protein